MSESPQERREREALERCTTDAQKARVRKLHAEGVCCYPEKRQGKSVIAAFTRYMESGDASKIDKGLYHFSIQGAGGLDEIAHFNLDGFRSVYRDPAKYLDLLDSVRPAYHHSSYVYSDGMTGQEVRTAIQQLAHIYANDVRERSSDTKRHEALAVAKALGQEFGFEVKEKA